MPTPKDPKNTDGTIDGASPGGSEGKGGEPNDPGGKPGSPEGGSPDPGDQGGEGKGDSDDPGGKLEDLPEWAQKQIKALRKESAKSRSKATSTEERLEKIEKGFKTMFGDEGDDDLTPEQKIEALQTQGEAVVAQAAMLEFCIDNGVTDKDDRKYLTFLINEAAEELEEGEELDDETLEGLIQNVRQKSGKKASSSADTGDKGGKGPNPEGGSNQAVSLDQFVNMGLAEKNKLFRENKDQYDSLWAQAREKNLI